MNKHPLADCESCSLRNSPYVPSKAPQGPATYAIVAESPGYTEALAKEPMVGASGKLIKEVLKRHGIPASECFLTNVVSCAPEQDEKPPTDAIEACRPRLMHELESCGATKILATGNYGAGALLQTSEGITRARIGAPRHVQLPSGKAVTVVPTIHPAYALRAADNFKHLVTDVGKLNAKPFNWQQPRFKVADTERKALAYIKFLEQFPKFAVDIETGTEKDVAFEHPDDTEILCVGLAYDARHAVIFPGEILELPIVGKLFGLLLANAQLTAQNGKFDGPVLNKFHPDIKIFHDTMLAHYCLDERTKIHGLEYMSMELLGSPPWKYMTKQYTAKGLTFAAVPRPVLYHYNAIDNINTFALEELFTPQLEQQGLVGLYRFLLRASEALMPVEREGVAVDVAYLQELDESFKAELETLEQPLHEWVENPRSPDQVKSALHRLGVDCASTRMPLLQELRKAAYEYQSSSAQARDVVRLINALETYRKAFKQYSTYVKGLKERVTKGRVHTSYLLHGTSTGRLSSRNPNLQNQPRGPTIRRLFIPGSPDNVLVKADFAQGEWRVVTILADEPYFAERFVAGRDVVGDLQEELFGNRTDKELRTKTKNILYGSLYGMILGKGDQGVHYARNVIFPDLPPKIAEQRAFVYRQKLFELAPNIIRWQQDTRRRVLDGEVLTNYKGRRRHFWLITNTNKHKVMNECLAVVPQATLSDICLTGLCELSEHGYNVRLSTHDEVVLEAHWSDAETVQKRMAAIMSEAAKEFSVKLPFPVETSIGQSWGDCS